MNDPLLFEAWKIRDKAAESAVLCGVLRWPIETIPLLQEMEFDAGCFSQHMNLVMYEVCLFVGAAGPDPFGVYTEFRKRDKVNEFVPGDVCRWIADLWSLYHWDAEIGKWYDDRHDGLPSQVAVALAMAVKVKNLAARRSAIHTAAAAARAALDGQCIDTDYGE